MKNILIGLDAVANLLDKKGLAKYAAQLDEITDSIANSPEPSTWSDRISEIGKLVKELDLSNPLFLRIDKIIQQALDSDKESGIKDFIGDVEVPNKVAFMHFLKELQEMVDQDVTFTKDDEHLIDELQRMTQRG